MTSRLLGWVGFAIVLGCSSAPATSTPDAAAHGCVAGSQIACACPSGAPPGVQVCSPTGDGFGMCTGCRTSSSPDGGREVTTTRDAARDATPDVVRDAERETDAADASHGDARDASARDAQAEDAHDGGCSEGTLACDGTQPQTCTGAGGWQNVGAPCTGATPACLAGACVACTPGATRCMGDGGINAGTGVEACNASGQWGSQPRAPNLRPSATRARRPLAASARRPLMGHAAAFASTFKSI